MLTIEGREPHETARQDAPRSGDERADASDFEPGGPMELDEMDTLGEFEFDDSEEEAVDGEALTAGGEPSKRGDVPPHPEAASSAVFPSVPEVDPFRAVATPSDPRALLDDWELMAALATAAAAAVEDTAAAAFVAAMVPVSLRLVPSLDRALWPAIPELLHGVVRLATALRSRPAGRHLLDRLPMILRRTSARLAREAAYGQPVTRELTAQILGKELRRAVAVDSSGRGFGPSQARGRRVPAAYPPHNGTARSGVPRWW